MAPEFRVRLGRMRSKGEHASPTSKPGANVYVAAGSRDASYQVRNGRPRWRPPPRRLHGDASLLTLLVDSSRTTSPRPSRATSCASTESSMRVPQLRETRSQGYGSSVSAPPSSTMPALSL